MLTVTTAQGFWGRFRGLMLTASLDSDAGLFLARCPSVHTCFMRYPIDIVYLDKHGRVVKIVPRLKPWRASVGGANAKHALELAAGTIERLHLGEGDDATRFLAHVPATLRGEKDE